MPFQVTTAVKKMLAMTARKKVIQGSTSSGKTYGIIPIIYDKMIANEGLKVTVVAETLPAVKEGALDIFKNFMYDEGRWNDRCWNASTLTYTRHNRSRIQFKSFDSVGKAKSSGKRDILFLNEGNHIPYQIADALMIRSIETWIDFNADEEFWAHTELLKEPNSEFLKLTYVDNEGIPPETLEDLLIKKAKADDEANRGIKGYYWNWWQVYGLGEIGSRVGVIFNNWTQIDDLPSGAKLVGIGLDFGFTNDPTAAVAVYQQDGRYILDELIYETGLLNSDIATKLKGHTCTIIADSAEPKSIEEIARKGLRIKGATKGQDSIRFGIQLLQEHEWSVTSRSLNLIKELRGYSWEVDKTGKQTGNPIGHLNHIIDAWRYWGLDNLHTKYNFSKPTRMRF
jgi:phage terminase large subunit